MPHLAGLELAQTWCSPAAELPQLLQHPNLARLQLLRLDADTSSRLIVDTMGLIAHLSQLLTLDVAVPWGATGVALLQPLAGASALTDLTVRPDRWVVHGALLSAVGAFAGLRRLSLHRVIFYTDMFLDLCSSANMSRLQHLELTDCVVTPLGNPPGPEESRAAFSALEQLQSLLLDRMFGVNRLLPHLHCAPTRRLLSIRCEPDYHDIGGSRSPLPRRDVLSALLTSAPQLEVRLLMPATLDRWLTRGQSDGVGRAMSEQQWREFQRMGAVMERVIIVDEEPHSA